MLTTLVFASEHDHHIHANVSADASAEVTGMQGSKTGCIITCFLYRVRQTVQISELLTIVGRPSAVYV